MLTDIKGIDVAGLADGIGWVYMNPRDGIPGIYQKTGGSDFNTYITRSHNKTLVFLL